MLRELKQERATSLEALRALVRYARVDRGIRGVVVEMPSLHAGWGHCASLRDVLLEARRCAKEVVVFLPEGAANREMFVASAADRVFVAPRSTVSLTGLSAESRYVQPLLERLGLRVEVLALGQYKTAAEPFVRSTMSDAQREQLDALLESMSHTLTEAVASRFGGDPARVLSAYERGPMSAADAAAFGLVDGACYEDELPTRVAAGKEEVPRFVDASGYLSFKGRKPFGRRPHRPYLAVVEIHGAISDGRAGAFRANGATGDAVVRAVRSARSDRAALGVVLHINSPGGSALESDRIHREVVRLREKKPVVACFGDVAASGGYYVAAPAHRIVAQPLTLTGSIGVISAKPVASELLRRVGVHIETRRTQPHADMFSIARGYDEAERLAMQTELRSTYDAFLRVVADGRDKTTDEVDGIARGRVWSGADALTRDLVDRLGGMAEAKSELLALLPARDRRLLDSLELRVAHPKSDPPAPEPVSAVQEAALLLTAGATGGVFYMAPSLPVVR